MRKFKLRSSHFLKNLLTFEKCIAPNTDIFQLATTEIKFSLVMTIDFNNLTTNIHV